MLSSILVGLRSFGTNSTGVGFAYLVGISAIIGAILPVTTVIFALYYDKVSEKSIELLDEIRDLRANQVEEIQKRFAKIVETTSLHNGIFRLTLRIYRLCSYGLGVLWLLQLAGYLSNTKESDGNSLNPTDITIVVGSTLLLIVILWMFPRIFSKVNALGLRTIMNEGCTLEGAIDLLVEKSSISREHFFTRIMAPSMIVEPRGRVHFEQKVPITGYSVLWELHGAAWRSRIKCRISKARVHSYNVQTIDGVRRKWESQGHHVHILRGLCDRLSDTDCTSSRVVIVASNRRNPEIFVGKVSIQHCASGNKYTLSGIEYADVEQPLLKAIISRSEFIEMGDNERSFCYALKHLK
ncbi:MAG: hypothetical protein ACYC6C_12465 [Coriobacteriia bacterium]